MFRKHIKIKLILYFTLLIGFIQGNLAFADTNNASFLPGEVDLYFDSSNEIENTSEDDVAFLGDHITHTVIFGNNAHGDIPNHMYHSKGSIYVSKYLDLTTNEITIIKHTKTGSTTTTVTVDPGPVSSDDPQFDQANSRDCDKKFSIDLDILAGGSWVEIQFRTTVIMEMEGQLHNYYYISGNAYKVNYNANDGTGGYEYYAVPFDYKTLSMEGAKIHREGYKLAGWNTQADGSGANYPVGSPFTLKNDDEAPDGLTLYAQWEKTEISTTGSTSDATTKAEDPSSQNTTKHNSLTSQKKYGTSSAGMTVTGDSSMIGIFIAIAIIIASLLIYLWVSRKRGRQ